MLVASSKKITIRAWQSKATVVCGTCETKAQSARFFSNQKSWVPTDPSSLQKITTQALLHEVALQQMESAQVVVPWYLKNMPVSCHSYYLFNTSYLLLLQTRLPTFDKRICQQESST